MAIDAKELYPVLKGNLKASLESIKQGRQTKGEIITSLKNKADKASNADVKAFYETAHTQLAKTAAVKLARRFYDVADIEDEMGTYFPDELENVVRNRVNQQRENSFALRHPIITGVPTLGI